MERSFDRTISIAREEVSFAYVSELARAEPQATEGGVLLGEPRALAAVLREPAVSLAGPALVSHAGSPADELLHATVYPLGSLVSGSAPIERPLPDEILRFGLGRTAGNDIVVADATVSKRHASIVRRSEGRWAIVDEDSSNGTFVDGTRLARGGWASLGALSTLRFGPRARFVFLQPFIFFEYLASLRAEVANRSLPLVPPSADAPRERMGEQTRPGGTFEPLAARIIARLRRAPAAERYRVRLGDAEPLEVATLSEAIALVERAPERVSSVELLQRDGTCTSVYDRE